MRAFPHLRPGPDVVSAGEWIRLVDDQELVLPEKISDWDYNVDLVLRRRVVVDVEQVRIQSGLPSGAPLALAVIWRSSGSRLSGCAARYVVTDDEPAREVEVGLRGSELGGVLTMTTTLTLAGRNSGGNVLAPKRAGTLLWSDEAAVRLQGDGSQFPMAVVDFSRTHHPDRAGWHLQISGSLESAAMGSLLLLINAEHESVSSAFRAAAKPSPQQRAILAAVRADVVRTLVDWAIARSDFDVDAEYPEFSLGSAVADLYRHMFDENDVEDIRLRREHDPAYYSTDLQSRLELFWDI